VRQFSRIDGIAAQTKYPSAPSSAGVKASSLMSKQPRTRGGMNFDAMVQQLRRSKDCRTILVEKVDRLAKNYEDFVLLKNLDFSSVPTTT
jgi:hypothetical protein